MKLAGQNVVVFDLETKRGVDGKEITWNDHHKMGISCGALFDFKTMDYTAYLDDNIEELVERLNRADLISGFNIINFDIPLLKATCKTPLNEKLPFYDVLPQSRYAAGWNESQPFPKGMRLDDHLEHTFGKDQMKTAKGDEAPMFYQSGQIGRLLSYCLADVKREAMLFRHVWSGLPVKTAFHGSRVLKDPKDPSFWIREPISSPAGGVA